MNNKKVIKLRIDKLNNDIANYKQTITLADSQSVKDYFIEAWYHAEEEIYSLEKEHNNEKTIN